MKMKTTSKLAKQVVNQLIESDLEESTIIDKIAYSVQAQAAEHSAAAEQAGGASMKDAEWANYIWELCQYYARYYRLHGEELINAARQVYYKFQGQEASGEQIGAARQAKTYEAIVGQPGAGWYVDPESDPNDETPDVLGMFGAVRFPFAPHWSMQKAHIIENGVHLTVRVPEDVAHAIYDAVEGDKAAIKKLNAFVASQTQNHPGSFSFGRRRHEAIDKKELAKGVKDEKKEHDMTDAEAKETATQHLTRVNKRYYSKVEKALGEASFGPLAGPQRGSQPEPGNSELEELFKLDDELMKDNKWSGTVEALMASAEVDNLTDLVKANPDALSELTSLGRHLKLLRGA